MTRKRTLLHLGPDIVNLPEQPMPFYFSPNLNIMFERGSS